MEKFVYRTVVIEIYAGSGLLVGVNFDNYHSAYFYARKLNILKYLQTVEGAIEVTKASIDLDISMSEL